MVVGDDVPMVTQIGGVDVNNEPRVPSSAASYLSFRSKAIQAVHSPLGFFVLALLIVETFLFGTGGWFDLPEPWKLAAMGVGVGLFLIVFATVVWLVVKYPQNLVFSEESHVQFQAMKVFGSDENLITHRDLEALPPESTPHDTTGQLSGPGEGG